MLFCFHEEDYDAYSKSLKNITTSIELTLQFMDTIAYNGYLEEYCPDSASVVGVNKKSRTIILRMKNKTLLISWIKRHLKLTILLLTAI